MLSAQKLLITLRIKANIIPIINGEKISITFPNNVNIFSKLTRPNIISAI